MGRPRNKTQALIRWQMIGLLCLTWQMAASAQAQLGNKHTDAGDQTVRQAQYVTAEPRLQVALTTALKTPSANAQVPTSVFNLAAVYMAQGEYAKAESVYQHVLALREETLGAWHSEVAALLMDYAKLLRRQYPWWSRLPWSLAARLSARAERIWQAEEEMEQDSGGKGSPADWIQDAADQFDDGNA